jgi:hypothetical protein
LTPRRNKKQQRTQQSIQQLGAGDTNLPLYFRRMGFYRKARESFHCRRKRLCCGLPQESVMAENWQFQIRITAMPALAEALRTNAPGDALDAILREANATLKCQYDAFADYVAEADRVGREHYPLYQWTKDTIENPEKKAKYLKSFTVYVDGNEVYDKDAADWLHARLSALADEGEVGIESVSRYDTNPANNPQPPARK